jgi:hypothetical protein
MHDFSWVVQQVSRSRIEYCQVWGIGTTVLLQNPHN